MIAPPRNLGGRTSLIWPHQNIHFPQTGGVGHDERIGWSLETSGRRVDRSLDQGMSHQVILRYGEHLLRQAVLRLTLTVSQTSLTLS